MSHRFPLQAGDVAPDFSGRDSSTAADRRPDRENPSTENQPGANAAPSGTSPVGGLWVPGQPAPNSFLSAPFDPIYTDEGANDEVKEIDCSQYGDAFDPEAPLRVMIDTRWNFDPDGDGNV